MHNYVHCYGNKYVRLMTKEQILDVSGIYPKNRPVIVFKNGDFMKEHIVESELVRNNVAKFAVNMTQKQWQEYDFR